MEKWMQDIIALEPKSGAFTGVPKNSKMAFEHDSQKALDKYLKQHPKADKSRHRVKEQRTIKPVKKEELSDDDSERVFGKSVKKTKFTVEDYFSHLKFADHMESEKAKNIAIHAFSKARLEFGAELEMRFGDDGKMNGVTTSHDNDGGNLELDAVASSGRVKGMGSFLVAKVIKDHLKAGQKLVLDAIPDAEPFYDKIGMIQGKPNYCNGHKYSFSHKAAVEFAERTFRNFLGESVAKAASELLRMARELIDPIWNGESVGV